MSDWFSKLVGFSERTPKQVRDSLVVNGETLISKVNGASYTCGHLEIVSLGELRARTGASPDHAADIQVAELVGDARQLHADPKNAGAVFQVASQFNLLEMVSPSVIPEQGIAIYEYDPTQGPACAIACAAGTIFRNYFVETNGQIGQTSDNQIDCLADVGHALGNTDHRLWKTQNGYALPNSMGLTAVDTQLRSMSEPELDGLRTKLRIGVHWNTQVTINECQHLVTQAYCSALPVAYSGLSSRLWERFARLVLEAAYEATLAVAVLNAAKTRNRTVFLTLLGGGAFGNEEEWILDAIKRALELYRHYDLDVRIVSFRRPNPQLQRVLKRASGM